jgi:tripartite-type tricarboxylate transporter receptor subunit TctC
MNFVVRGLLAAGAALWLIAATAVTPYPTKPIRFIVPYAPGSDADLMARAMEPVLTERLRQPVIVENRPGAGGNVGIEAVAKSAPDGYTIGLGGWGALAANVALYPKLAYDPIKDLAPVANVAFIPFVLVAHPAVPANSLAELVELARAKPGELLLGYGGNGTAAHLAAELFKLMAKVQMVNVPYKSSGHAVADAVNGKLPLALVDVAAAQSGLKSGKLKAIAVTSAKRVFAAPSVPTFAEAGLAGYEATGWFGIVAAAGTPPDIVGRLNSEVLAALKRAEVRDRVIAAGAEPAPGTPADFGTLMGAEIAKWSDVVRLSGARPD